MVLPSSNVRVAIHRAGHQVTILEEHVTGTDEFNNPEYGWQENPSDDPPVYAIRTYPNRNRQNDMNGGPYDKDRPLFMFTPDDAPDEGARVIYNSVTYELGSATIYDTHTVFLAKKVTT